MDWRTAQFWRENATRQASTAIRFAPGTRCGKIDRSPSTSLSSRGLGHRPFTAATRVRIPLGTPLDRQSHRSELPSSARLATPLGSPDVVGRLVVVDHHERPDETTQQHARDARLARVGPSATLPRAAEWRPAAGPGRASAEVREGGGPAVRSPPHECESPARPLSPAHRPRWTPRGWRPHAEAGRAPVTHSN